MTNLGYKTQPMKVGAPLPPEMAAIEEPLPMDIASELRRAKVELMYAIARHRQAWSAMRAYHQTQTIKAERGGVIAFLDSDPTWKVKTGDVTWWRGEMQAQAATVQTLTLMIEQAAKRRTH